jgi:hypothetical protein
MDLVEPMAFFWSQSKKLTCGFKKYAIVGSIILEKIRQHQMKCLRTKCIETFPIYICLFKKFNLALSSLISQ